MTITTPTSDLTPGLPGEAELTQLANRLFREGLQLLSSGSDREVSAPVSAPVPAQPGPSVRSVHAPVVPGVSDDFATLPSPAGRIGGGAPGAVVDSPAAAQARVEQLARLALATGRLESLPAVPHGLSPPGFVAGYPGAAVDTPAAAQARVEQLARLALPTAPPATEAVVAGGVSHQHLEEQVFHPRVLGAAPSPAPEALAQSGGSLDVDAVRADFPILDERLQGGRKLVWFDNAATTQKPQSVIDRLSEFYRHENSNIHRAAHELARRATDAYEDARGKAARLLGAATPEEIVFVRGATEAINLVAASFGAAFVRRGDEILLSELEHHANIVPWQQLAERVGAGIRVIPVDDRGDLRLETLPRLLGPRTRIVSFTHVSNALGTITPAQELIHAAHAVGARVLLDGAQSVAHMPVDVRLLGADFYVFSGHKVFGPTGIGVLYGRSDILHELPPWQGGGNMIRDVTFERTVYQEAPTRFEAGTGNIADAVGLGAAIDYVQRVGLPAIQTYEHHLVGYAREALSRIKGLELIGSPRHHASVLSFVVPGQSNSDVGRALSDAGIAVRAGHHCAQPILRRFGHESTVRASLAFYNTVSEVDYFVDVLTRIVARGSARS